MPGSPDRRAALAAALLLAAAPSGAWAAGPCALEVLVEPPFLELGQGARAVVRVAGTDEPCLTVSAGRLERLRPEGGGWAADFVPPEEAHPQVAILAALAGDACGHAAIPLHGQGDAIAHTRRFKQVEVRIGDRLFGPARADANGEAVVPVVVPPGVHVAYHGQQAIPLRSPPVEQLHLALDRSSARADLEAEVAVLAVAVAEDGSPWRGAPPALLVSEGELAPVGRQGPDAFRWRWRLPPGAARTARLSAALPEGQPPRPVEVGLVAGPPARVQVALAQARAAAGGEVGLRVTVVDAAGNAATGTPLFQASVGRVRPEAPDGPGAWRAALAVPERLAEARRVEVVAWVEGATGRAVVELEPGPVERLSLSNPGGEVPADGESEVALALEAVDRFGNPVDGTPEVSAGHGRVGAERVGSGWRLRYRAPRLDGEGEDAVRARLGPAAGEARIGLARRTRALDLSLRLGLAVRAGNPLAPEVGVAAVHWPRRLRGRVGLGLAATWSSLARRDQVSSAGVPVALESRADFAALEVVALLRRGLGPRLLGWVELGAGGALAATRLTQPALPAVGAPGWVPLAHGALALGLRSGPFLEARAAWQGDARSEALRGPLKTLTLSAGWRLETF